MQSSSITRPEEAAGYASKSLGEAVNFARLREGRKDVPKKREKGKEKKKKGKELSKCTQKCHKPVYAVITVATVRSIVGEIEV